jgi:L-alanine-DL-glutamate epimerase-like enolase superfamily enzyme
MDAYDDIAALPLYVEGSERSQHASDTSSGFRRVTTGFALSGDGETGRGEDVTYETADHEALADAPAFDFAGEWTFGEFSEALAGMDLFPTKEPEEERFRHYRRWAVESAALDLALRQAGRSLGDVLGREYEPVRFVASTRLPDDTADRVHDLLDAYPDLELKLDPTPEWDAELIGELADTGAVRVVDLKGLYEGTEVDAEPDAEFYRRVFEGFPDAVVEDPATTEETQDVVRAHGERVSWDLPITGVESVEALPFEPNWLNIKPSRFGSVESLLATIAYCEEHDVTMYGGGQFELGVGREQLQALASLCYPDSPNDIAPGGYNDPEVREGLPTSPLPAPADEPGFRG